MTTLQKVCGNPNSPTVGMGSYQNDLFQNAFMHFIIVNNINENGLTPAPDYIFDATTGTIDRSPNTWQLGDKVIFVYSKCV